MEISEPIKLDSMSETKEVAIKLILCAVKQVYLITQNLETNIYNNLEIYQHLSHIAKNNRKADIRIIAHDTRFAASQGHYLIHLCQKLPSFAQIRTTVTREHKNFKESWLMVDDGAYLRLRNPEIYLGHYELDNKLESKGYQSQFLNIWEACGADQNTRRLSI